MSEKYITITFTGDMATGKTRFMEALAELLKNEEDIEVVDLQSRSEGGKPHSFKIKSSQALHWAELRNK